MTSIKDIVYIVMYMDYGGEYKVDSIYKLWKDAEARESKLTEKSTPAYIDEWEIL